jgi:hypothetical protein
MDIYDIGTEKCIDGVWGREVSGRFYTYYFKSDNCLTLYRKVDVDNEENDWFVSLKVGAHLESVTCTKQSWLTKYTPNHTKDLENLKRGDVVWVSSVQYDNKEQWATARFIGHDGYDYLVANLFDTEGASLRHYSHKEVFLKPPFDF